MGRTTLDGSYKVVEKSITDSDYKEFCDANREPTLFGNVGTVDSTIPSSAKRHRLCADCEFIARKQKELSGYRKSLCKTENTIPCEKHNLFFWNRAMDQHKATSYPNRYPIINPKDINPIA